MYLIEILHQTTTAYKALEHAVELYLIEILHQTTTNFVLTSSKKSLYLIEILHQTTTSTRLRVLLRSCILSKFYIKPQQIPVPSFRTRVVSYRNSTSNHNFVGSVRIFVVLYLIEILHQTTTHVVDFFREYQLYLIEILHQTTTSNTVCRAAAWLYLIEILHQTTTYPCHAFFVVSLYLIEILHQTTTNCMTSSKCSPLYLIEILHQTTTGGRKVFERTCCILSKFYIKPQRAEQYRTPKSVVSYRNSTSNHNLRVCACLTRAVVSYRNSTSNHNPVVAPPTPPLLYLIEILHQTTTQNNTSTKQSALYLIEILHQTTTPSGLILRLLGLYLIEILHQTTTINRGRR